MMLQRHRNKSLSENPAVEPAYKAGVFVVLDPETGLPEPVATPPVVEKVADEVKKVTKAVVTKLKKAEAE